MPIQPVVTGLVGLGGYARNIRSLLLSERGQAGEADKQVVHLAAACSSNPSRHPEAVAELEANGAKIVPDFDAMLAMPEIEAVWLPLPIDLHVPFTEKALAAGKAVMLEKPVAGCVQDVDRLIAARDKAGLPVLIGFQDNYDPVNMQFKKRLLAGAIGNIRSATVWCIWPRDSRYYGRASWAGAMKKDGAWVMDSPANNAMAHFINIALFFLGKQPNDAAAIEQVEVELYRVNPIENYDTISMRLTVEGGVPILFHLTHAAREGHNPRIRILGDAGEANWIHDGPVTVSPSAPAKADLALAAERHKRPQLFMAERFTKLIRGIEDDEVPMATLESARAQVLAINGASEATKIKALPESAYDKLPHEEGSTLRAIPGIEQAFVKCTEQGKMLHESGLYDWTVPAGTKNLVGYKQFSGPLG